MPGIVAAFVIGILLVVLLFAGGRAVRADDRTSPAPVAGASVQAVKAMSRAEIAARLKALSDRPAPKNLSPGAMCYAPAPFRDVTAGYVCPKCGERTMYQAPLGHPVRDEMLSALRALAKKLRPHGIRVDGSQFYRKCSPAVTDPKLVLKVTHEGSATPHTVEGITLADVQLLDEFLTGRDVHSGTQGRELPLKESLVRLQELPGVQLPR